MHQQLPPNPNAIKDKADALLQLNEEPRFTGFKEKVKKASSGKKRRTGVISAAFVPLFDEDSDGCVVEREEQSTAEERFSAFN